MLAAAGSATLQNHFKAQVYFLTAAEGGRSKPYTKNFSPDLFSKTWHAPCQVLQPEGKDMIMPGEDANITFYIKKNMFLEKLDIERVEEQRINEHKKVKKAQALAEAEAE